MLAGQVDESLVSQMDFNQVRDKISLFGGLSDHQMGLIVPNLEVLSLQKGDVVFQQGQLPCNVYIMMSGEVRLDICREDDSHVTMHFVRGDCFGETAVIGIQPQLGKAQACKGSQILALSRTFLLDLVNVDKELFGILMMNIAREVSRRLHSVVVTPVAQSNYPILRA